MGGPALRTVATLGGNICNASPAADTLPFLYAFEATMRLASATGERDVPIVDFIRGPGKTTLRADEILTAIIVPGWQPAHALWRKVGTRRANALTKLSIAAFADLAGPDRRVRFALGAVAPTVVRLPGVETLLQNPGAGGTNAAASLADEAAERTRAAVRPIDDQRSTAEYRREVAAGLVADFVRQVLAH
jgi:CO/xanthine dehydrogenase FAD-binding subunit